MRDLVKQLVPMAFVADVPRSIAFYAHFGFTVGNTFTPPDAVIPSWAWLKSSGAHLMVSKASEPVDPERQAVLFYLYTEDVGKTRELLVAAGLNPSEITKPFYAPHGEFRVIDPDGYVLMVTHV